MNDGVCCYVGLLATAGTQQHPLVAGDRPTKVIKKCVRNQQLLTYHKLYDEASKEMDLDLHYKVTDIFRISGVIK